MTPADPHAAHARFLRVVARAQKRADEETARLHRRLRALPAAIGAVDLTDTPDTRPGWRPEVFWGSSHHRARRETAAAVDLGARRRRADRDGLRAANGPVRETRRRPHHCARYSVVSRSYRVGKRFLDSVHDRYIVRLLYR